MWEYNFNKLGCLGVTKTPVNNLVNYCLELPNRVTINDEYLEKIPLMENLVRKEKKRSLWNRFIQRHDF